MILDTSAIVAFLKNESTAAAIESALARTNEEKRISAGTYLESCIVIDSLMDGILSRRLMRFLEIFKVSIVPVTEAQVAIARESYADFGKGSKQKAQLNFGDCFAYALAYELREPILCVGDDFVHTDLRVVPLIEPPEDLG